MKSKMVFVLVLFFSFLGTAQAEYKFGFGNVSINYLNWDSGTEDKSTKEDFTYLELEGFGQFSWGEVYGFFDLENLGEDDDELRTASKGILRYYIGKSNWSVYLHEYTFMSSGFSEQNRVVGFGYQLASEKWWFKPFLGFHDVIQPFYSGANGFMGGWVLGYNFQLSGHSFTAANWHELEFARNESYASGNGEEKLSHNGAAVLFWNVNTKATLAVQWRYAVDKLGTGGSQNAMIFSMRRNFE